jgi:hypothetical protein
MQGARLVAMQPIPNATQAPDYLFRNLVQLLAEA